MGREIDKGVCMSSFQAWVERMLWRASFGGITELQIGRDESLAGTPWLRFEALLLGPVHPFTHTSPSKRETFDVLPPERAVVGARVSVHAFGHWYNTGKVLKVTPRRVTVQYTNKSGITRTKAVPMDSGLVR